MTANDLTDLVVGSCQVDASAAVYFYQMGNIGALTDNAAGDFTIALAPSADVLEHQYSVQLLGADGDVKSAIELVDDVSVRVRTFAGGVAGATGILADIDFQLTIRKIRRVDA